MMAWAMSDPANSEVWLADLGTPVGHESGETRPVLVVSDDRANNTGLVIVCPITRTRRPYPTRIEIEPTGTGLAATSYVQTEQIRALSTLRLLHRLGRVVPLTTLQVERSLRFLLRV